eukprot:2149085-Amphidinium_carterae.1
MEIEICRGLFMARAKVLQCSSHTRREGSCLSSAVCEAEGECAQSGPVPLGQSLNGAALAGALHATASGLCSSQACRLQRQR